jgi:peptidoglycan/LPS O-acetylase OafA/YrhL
MANKKIMNKKYTNFFRSRQRNGIIEVYRFLLISIVFICHFFLDKSILGKVNSDIYLSQIFNGGICVVAFTIVSGYFLKNNTKYR